MSYAGEGSNEPERETQVFAQLTDYRAKVSQLTGIVVALESKLQSVLKSVGTLVTQESKKEPRVLVPLAQEIKDINNKMAEQINIIESIITRLEV